MQKKVTGWKFGAALAAALLCLAGAPAPASAAMSPEDRAVLEVEDMMQGIDRTRAPQAPHFNEG